VQRTAESRRLEWLISAVGGVLALGAVWQDMTTQLPLSLVGLVFAVGLLADYIRITWLVRGRFLIYEPARLSILTALATCKSADYLFLQSLTGLTGGNLSSHLAKLEEGGLILLEKRFVDKRPNTLVQLTEKGRSAIERHWMQLEALRKDSRTWKPPD